MEGTTLYEQFIYHMEKIGFVKKFSVLKEADVILSANDDVIYINANNCNAISIKGVNEARIKRKVVTQPHYFSMKVYTYDGEEARPEDAIQFSIIEFKKAALPTVPEVKSHTVYYHYPYRVASEKLRFKKGIVITKNKRLEIRIIRGSSPLKIAKFELNMECDKWFKKEKIAHKYDIQMVNQEIKQRLSDIFYNSGT